MIYPRHVIPNPTDVNLSPDVGEALTIKNDENRDVYGWFLKADGSFEVPRPTVVFFHGNAELAEMNIPLMNHYVREGYNVLLPEFRGYGKVYGSPSQVGIVSDMKHFISWLRGRDDVDKGKIIYHGRSLGGGVACALAADVPPAALVLESTFFSVAAIAKRYLVPSFFLLDPYPNDKIIPTLDLPILIVHGKHDEVIPFSHGKALSEISPKVTIFPQERSHNELMSRSDWERIIGFLKKAL
jgi:fermentation-respiration switch protein FrsA (DUF1100 family)